MRRMMRGLVDGLALLLGLGPSERTLAVVLAAAGVVTLNWFSNATLTLLEGPAKWDTQFWIALLGLPAVLLVFFVVTRRVWRRRPEVNGAPISASGRPAAAHGLIVFLSNYRVFPNKLPAGRACRITSLADLNEATNAVSADWPCILDHAQASNLQVPLEALRFHLEQGALRHVWVLATTDTTDATGKTVNGSRELLEAFARIVREGLHWEVEIHDGRSQAELIVPPYNVQEVFKAVDRIYREEAGRAGLHAEDVIGDITSGTVTMTAGMLLACALLRRPIQFTATGHDPADGRALEMPSPYAIRVDATVLRRLALGHLAAEALTDVERAV